MAGKEKGREMALDRRKIEREGKAEGEKRSRVIARSVDDLSLLRCCGVTLTYRSGIWRKKFAAEENNNTRGEKENGKVCALLNYNMYRRRCIRCCSKVNRLVRISS